MKIKQLLTTLGLSEAASSIYLTLLKHGISSISDISKQSGIYRPVVYKHLPSLIEHTLVAESMHGKRVMYSAESPTVLEHLADNVKNTLEQELPGMLLQFHKQGHRPTIRYFEGREGISHVYETLLQGGKKGDIIYRYESPKDFHYISKYYPKLYWNIATRRSPTGQSQIQKFVITNEQTQKNRPPRLERYSKAVPAKFDVFEYDITQIVYGDKVAFIDFATETASLIESKSFANFQRQIFKLLFNFLE
jgi:predicted transcriptional regulator